jgi:cell division septation protein DedD
VLSLSLSVLIVLLVLVVGLPAAGQQASAADAEAGALTCAYSGNVYCGAGETRVAMPDVVVSLYGWSGPDYWGDLLDRATTDAFGYFSLSTELSYNFYHVVETNPPGYVSIDAWVGPGGRIVTFDWIRFAYPLSCSSEGLRFNDQFMPTRTPTPTITATPAETSTPTRTTLPTATATATTTATMTPSATPTDTATVTPTGTPTRTPTATATASVTPSSTLTLTPTGTPVMRLYLPEVVRGGASTP